MDSIIVSTMTGAAGSLIAKTFDGPFKSLEDLWYYHVGYKTEQMRLERKQAINEYKQDIFEELSKIPEENRCNPRKCVAGSAIQDSLNFVEEPELRKMFAKLIASASDKTKYSLTHPAFSKIISQLSPLEAKILQDTDFLIKSKPCCKIRFQTSKIKRDFVFTESAPGYDIINHFYIPDTENNLDTLTNNDTDLYSAIIDNLNRLNLCEIPLNYSLSDPNYYTKFLNIPSLNTFLFNHRIHVTNNYPGYEDYYIAFIKEATLTTSFGKLFYHVCVKDNYLNK